MMPNRFASVLIASALSSAAAAALAQPAPSATVAPVTVEAQALPPRKVIEKQSSDFVQHLAGIGNPEIDQISRWHDPVCVLALGLAPEQAALIKARIEGVAQEVGLPAAWAKGRGCRPNVEIVFTHRPQALMDAVAQRRENLLGYYHFIERKKLKTVSRPIQSWYVTATRGGGGDIAGLVFANVGGGSSRGLPVQRNMGVIDDPENQSPGGCADRFTACYSSAIDNVLIVADSNALEGKDLGLVADYMVMLALSKPRSLDGCNALPSIIDQFAPSACPVRDPPNGLTPADAAYLTGLYDSDPAARKTFEQSDITRRMAAILIKASAGATSLPALGAKGPRQAH
jgi:hypothetical protein